MSRRLSTVYHTMDDRLADLLSDTSHWIVHSAHNWCITYTAPQCHRKEQCRGSPSRVRSAKTIGICQEEIMVLYVNSRMEK
jgi:hypothetical protein